MDDPTMHVTDGSRHRHVHAIGGVLGALALADPKAAGADDAVRGADAI